MLIPPIIKDMRSVAAAEVVHVPEVPGVYVCMYCMYVCSHIESAVTPEHQMLPLIVRETN